MQCGAEPYGVRSASKLPTVQSHSWVIAPNFPRPQSVVRNVFLVELLSASVNHVVHKIRNCPSLLVRACIKSGIRRTVMNKMPKELGGIAAISIGRLFKYQPCQSRYEIPKTFWRNEANRVPAGIADIFNRNRSRSTRQKSLIMFCTFFAVFKLSEMYWALAFVERRTHSFKSNGIICNHRGSMTSLEQVLRTHREGIGCAS